MTVQLMYLVAALCFILALKGLSSPKYARYGKTAEVVGLNAASAAMHERLRGRLSAGE